CASTRDIKTSTNRLHTKNFLITFLLFKSSRIYKQDTQLVYFRIMVTSLGASICETTCPLASLSCRTRITPNGVGKVPSANAKFPKFGLTVNATPPGSATFIPNTCSDNQ